MLLNMQVFGCDAVIGLAVPNILKDYTVGPRKLCQVVPRPVLLVEMT